MAEMLGQTGRMQINMGTTAVPVWKQFQNEVEVSIDLSAEFEDVSSKDTGTHKKKLKTLLDTTVSVTAYDDTAPTTNFISYKDVYDIATKTAGASGGTTGTGLGNGAYEFKFNSTTTGDFTLAFTAFIDKVSTARKNMGKVEYNFNVQVTSLPTKTTV